MEQVKPNNISPLPNAPLFVECSVPIDHNVMTLTLMGWTRPENTEHAPLLFLHDLGEDANQYLDICQELAKAGVNAYVYNLRNHGPLKTKEDGPRVHARMKAHVRDLLQVCAWVRHQENLQAPTLVACGLSTVVASDFCQRYSAMVGRMVLSAPTLQLLKRPSRMSQFVLDLCAEIFPTKTVPYSVYSVLASAQKSPSQEPKHSFRMNAGFVMELMHLIPRLTARLTQTKIPTLVFCPENDDRSSYEHILRLANSPRYTHLTAFEFADCPRQVFNHAPELAVTTIMEWLTASDSQPFFKNATSMPSEQENILDVHQSYA